MRAPYQPGRWARWRPPDREWLEKQHLELGKSINQIRKEINAHWCTVEKWLDEAGVPLQVDGRHNQPSGNESPSWKGGSWFYHHKQARSVMQQTPKVCELCGSDRFVVVHHIDGNESNNERDNLQYLCKSCHKHKYPRKGD